MDVQKTLAFAESVCKDARGNVTKMNRIATNKALKFYMDNVAYLRTVEPEIFAISYPEFMEEIESIRLQVEKAEEAEQAHVDQGDRIAALEAKMDKLTDALTRFMASTDTDTEEDEEDDEEDEPTPAPKKRTRKPKPSDEEGQAAPADDAEGEPEETEG